MNVKFNGYYSEEDINCMPSSSGVYVVYRGKPTNPREFDPIKIIYIGKAANLQQRIKNHDKYDNFKRALYNGEELYFSCALVSGVAELDAIENALICSQSPALNEVLVDNFKREISDFNISGACALVDPHPWKLKEPFTITVAESQ